MSKFVIVKEQPKKLKDGEIVITSPDFVNEIKSAKRFSRGTGRNLTTLQHLKAIVANIAESYDPEGLNFITAIPYNKYEGVEFTDDKDLSEKVVVRMMQDNYPSIFTKCLDAQIKARPSNTSLIYFVGSENDIEPFFKNGIDKVTPKEAKKVE